MLIHYNHALLTLYVLKFAVLLFDLICFQFIVMDFVDLIYTNFRHCFTHSLLSLCTVIMSNL